MSDPTKASSVILDPQKFRGTDKMFGVWRGTIEYVIDPLQLGRVKVRIPFVHGLPENLPTEALPWANWCFTDGGGPDFGSFSIPPVGTAVFVVFEQGDANYPIVLGTWYGVPETSQEFNTFNDLPDVDISMGTWNGPTGNEVPKEAQDVTNKDPQRRVIFKTPKGNTLYVEDKDGAEFLRLIDRVGQAIEMYCPVTTDQNEGNAAQRGVRMAVDNTPEVDPFTGEAEMKTQLSVEEYCVDQQAWIKIKDARGQYLKLWAKQGAEKVIMYGESGHFIILDSEDGNEKIRIEDKSGNFIQLDAVANDETVYVQHDQNEVVVNDNVKQVGNNKKTTVGANETRSVGNDRQTTVNHDEITNVGNDRNTTITNDDTVSVGNDRKVTVKKDSAVIVGGDEKRSITGDSDEVVGGDKAINATGDYDLSAKSFNVYAGGAKLTLVGNFEVMAFGQVNIQALSTATVQALGPLILQGLPVLIN